ncbi:M48 family metallopeptidase, partial [Klebsiella pneumoniae]|nr:M48 family metallopeptidase [Klebsiella pneumoniae]
TAPVFCSKKQIRHFIEQSESWLIKTWQSQQEKIENIDRTLPSELRLFNLKAPLKISYQSQKNNFIFDHEDLQLWISDRHPEEYLKAFVIAYAKEHLPSYLNLVSQQCHLPFKNCNIRHPKTRWGSCSAK